MANNNRKLLLREYGQLYHRMEGVELDTCWYCNHQRECLDHCPPVACIADLDKDKFVESGGLFLLIPSCNDCNHFLGAARLGTPYERLEFLERKYTKLTNKHFSNWTKAEIAQLGYNLREMVYAKDRMMRDLIRKLHCIEYNLVRYDR